MDNLDIEDIRHLYSALRLGLWGPYGEYKRSYFALAKQNEIAEILRATALGKKFKATPFANYHDLFPFIDDAETLGLGSAARQKAKSTNMAVKAVMALGGDAPSWLLSEIQ